MIRQKAKEYTHTCMKHSTKANGKKTNNTVREEKLGQMELCMKEIILLGKSMVKADLSGQMAQYTWDNS